jgi:hypothetical protein
MDERAARLADNGAVFRAGNEAIALNVGARKNPTARYGYLCECGNDQCFEPVQLTMIEYNAVRAGGPTRFFVVPGHHDPTAGEILVGELEGYLIIERAAGDGAIVESDRRLGGGLTLRNE